ncbi:hypothetical protein [Poseidonibacter ostreae]|uniref:Uncharacterized protein n=1 Tax=Poseidonibacter ostreae TaxID=2654171 RepID=A0A6L4WZI7_9BACT|nr:hypothetical protein [Poseidonibacter ostreae]KAB7891394.1 hypothetical protein GBG19_00730 [Poseidonibacter ostreae]
MSKNTEKKKSKSNVLSFKVTDEHLEDILFLCKKKNIPKSQLLRGIVTKALEETSELDDKKRINS